MIEVAGKYNTAKIFTDNLEDKSREQIVELCDQPAFEDSKIRIMPDVHAGKGCVIGFTANMGNKIIPNLIGVDIGCGVEVVLLGQVDIDLIKLDRYVRKKIPNGRDFRKEAVEINDEFKEEIAYAAKRINNAAKLNIHYRSLGTLGGGNHFIELDKDNEGNSYLLIHSGSRNFGYNIANYFQREAVEYCKGKSEDQASIYNVPSHLAFLEDELAEDYLKCMKIAQKYADFNRQVIVQKIIEEFLGLEAIETFTTVHNYIDDSGMIRKGAVSAKLGEKLVIPANMRDGAIIAVGKGNPDWNNSAPHGAGRLMSRTRAFNDLKLEDYKASMEGIYSTSVCKDTLDEAPMAYKPIEEILSDVGDTVDIIAQIKPVYNFKAKE